MNCHELFKSSSNRVTAAGLALIVLSVGTAATPAKDRTCLTIRPGDLRGSSAEEAAARAEMFEFKRVWKARTATAKRNRLMREEKGLPAIQATADGGTAVTGTLYLPVLLARFSDSPGAPFSMSQYDNMLNTGAASLSAYYQEVSYGLFDVSSTVKDWVQLPRWTAYYTNGEYGRGSASRTGDFIRDAVELNDASVDFGLFDNDGSDGVPNSGDDDGCVDVLVLVHELKSGSEPGDYNGVTDSNRFWSHRGAYSEWAGSQFETNDPSTSGGNIKIDDYLICSAVNSSASLIEIGVFAHELGHGLGIRDLYDTADYGAVPGAECAGSGGEGIGHWGLMGNGNRNTPSSPAHMSAWTKAELGWLTPEVIETNRLSWPIASATTNQVAYKLWTAGHVAKEYFLVELRTQDGFDSQLKQEGILIWHVDESKLALYDLALVNANECHPLLDLECANQTAPDHTMDHDDLAAGGVRSSPDHVWTGGSSFSNISTPSNVAYDGHNTSVKVNVRYDSGMNEWSADLIVGLANAGVDLCVRDCIADACGSASWCDNWYASPDIYVDNDEDGAPDSPLEGSNNIFKVHVRNVGIQDAQNVAVNLYISIPLFGRNFYESVNIPIGVDFISAIPAAGEEVATINAPVPHRYGDIERFSYVAIASTEHDLPGFLDPIFENNMAIINRYDFFHSVTGAPAPSADVYAVTPTHTSSHTIVALNDNPVLHPDTIKVRPGTPPLYNDFIVPVGWQYIVDPDSFVVAPGDSQNVLVTVIKNDPQHGDFLYLPLTATSVSGDSVISGNIMRWEIDNVPPSAPTGFVSTHDIPGGGDNMPLRDAVFLHWSHSGLDINGGVEEVESWEVYADSVPNFPPADSLHMKTLAIDWDPDTPGMQTWVDVPTLGPHVWFRVYALDRAGNRSLAATSALQTLVVTGIRDGSPPAAPVSLALYPNPASGSVRMDVSSNQSGTMKLEVFDVAGRRVRAFAPGSVSGSYTTEWNRLDNAGRRVASGVYFVRVEHAGHIATRKLVLVR